MPYTTLVFVHVAAGFVSLLTFWISVALRKGTPRHRRIGATYLLSMTLVLATTPLLAAAAFARGQVVAGVFLSYLLVITGTAAWSAWRAIRDRASPDQYFGGSFRAIGWLNIVSGFAVLVLGFHYGQLVLVGMSFIGLVVGGNRLREARRPPLGRGWWLRQHYSAILGCGIATHIAFLNIGLQKLLPAQFGTISQYAGWFAPVMIAALAKRWLDRRYGLGAQGTSPTAAAP